MLISSPSFKAYGTPSSLEIVVFYARFTKEINRSWNYNMHTFGLDARFSLRLLFPLTHKESAEREKGVSFERRPLRQKSTDLGFAGFVCKAEGLPDIEKLILKYWNNTQSFIYFSSVLVPLLRSEYYQHEMKERGETKFHYSAVELYTQIPTLIWNNNAVAVGYSGLPKAQKFPWAKNFFKNGSELMGKLLETLACVLWFWSLPITSATAYQ